MTAYTWKAAFYLCVIVNILKSSFAAQGGSCTCVGNYESEKDSFHVRAFSGENLQLDAQHRYTATTFSKGLACDHQVSWATDPTRELMKVVIIKLLQSGETLKLSYDIDDDGELITKATDLSSGAESDVTISGGMRQFRSTPISFRFDNDEFELTIDGCGLKVLYSPDKVRLEDLDSEGHDGGVCNSCAGPKGKGEDTNRGFNFGSFGDAKLAEAWERLSWVEDSPTKLLEDSPNVAQFCEPLMSEDCAEVNIYRACLLALVHFDDETSEHILLTGLKVFREKCGRPVREKPQLGRQRCIATRSPRNRLFLTTFDNMKFDLTTKATYLLTKRMHTGQCDHELTMTLADSKDDPVWIKFVDIVFTNTNTRISIKPRRNKVPLVFEIDSDGNKKAFMYIKRYRSMSLNSEFIVRRESDNSAAIETGSCDLKIRVSGRRIYLRSSNTVLPANLIGACGNGNGNPIEPMPTDVFTDMYKNINLRKYIYSLAWQQGRKYPLGSKVSNEKGREICSMYFKESGKLGAVIRDLTKGQRDHFRTTCRAMVNEFHDSNKVVMYKHVCKQFSYFNKLYGKNQLDMPDFCKSCTCRVAGIRHQRFEYNLFDGSDQVLSYDGGCPQLLVEKKSPLHQCYFRVEIDVRERDGNKDIVAVRMAVGHPPKHIVLPSTPEENRFYSFRLTCIGSDKFVVRSSMCGVKMTYVRPARRVYVRLDPGHEDTTQGVCGTCNLQKDDMVTATGIDVSSLQQEIASHAIVDSYQVGDWVLGRDNIPKKENDKYFLKTQYVFMTGQVPVESCMAREERFTECKPKDEKEMYKLGYCGHIANMDGLFGQCLKDGTVSTETMRQIFRECMKAVCKSKWGRRKRACDVKEKMANLCGVSFDKDVLCPIVEKN